ncbi:hypothetical protein Ancab_027625 [Ancistrocladus abbreviatus]
MPMVPRLDFCRWSNGLMDSFDWVELGLVPRYFNGFIWFDSNVWGNRRLKIPNQKTPTPTSLQHRNSSSQITEDSSNLSVQEQLVSENSNADSSNANGDDLKAKGAQNPTGVMVVTPTASSSPDTDILKKLHGGERVGLPV